MPGPIFASLESRKGLLSQLEEKPKVKGLLGDYIPQNTYRGTILPFEKNMDTGEINFAVPGMLSGLLDSAENAYSAPYRAYTGQLPMTDDAGNTSPQAIAEAANMAGFLTLGPGALPASTNDLRMGVKLMHASPHEFDKFERSAATRLSGEGNSTFGDGLYFAENPETAASYVRQFVDSHGKATKYKVDLDVEADHVLDLGKPLSEQPKEIRDKMVAVLPKQVDPLDYLMNWDGSITKEIDKKHYDKMLKLTGGEAYQLLESTLGSQKAASDALQKAGVPAMRYLDAGSREAGKGTYNYIVVDPSPLKILDKEKYAPKPTPELVKALTKGTSL